MSSLSSDLLPPVIPTELQFINADSVESVPFANSEQIFSSPPPDLSLSDNSSRDGLSEFSDPSPRVSAAITPLLLNTPPIVTQVSLDVQQSLGNGTESTVPRIKPDSVNRMYQQLEYMFDELAQYQNGFYSEQRLAVDHEDMSAEYNKRVVGLINVMTITDTVSQGLFVRGQNSATYSYENTTPQVIAVTTVQPFQPSVSAIASMNLDNVQNNPPVPAPAPKPAKLKRSRSQPIPSTDEAKKQKT